MSGCELRLDAVDGEIAEAVAEVWRRFGETDVVVEEHSPPDAVPGAIRPAERDRWTVRMFLSEEVFEQRLQKIEEATGWLRRILPFPELECRPLDDRDWSEAWRSRHGRIRVGRRLLILPPWDEDPIAEDLVAVRVEPGSAFGVGSHPTTRLALALLEDALRPGLLVADVGCGSGILALAAARLGARVAACDVDPAAVRATRAEAGRNEVADRIQVVHGSTEALAGSAPFDVLVANIVADVLLRVLPASRDLLSPGGTLLLSGMLADREEEVVRAAEATGPLRWTSRRTSGDWVGRAAETLGGPTA